MKNTVLITVFLANFEIISTSVFGKGQISRALPLNTPNLQ